MTDRDMKVIRAKRTIALWDDLALVCLIGIAAWAAAIVGLIVLAAMETQTINNLLRVIWP